MALSVELGNLKLENEALKKVIESTNRDKMKTQQDKKMKRDLDNLIKQMTQSNSLIERVELKNEKLLKEAEELREDNEDLKQRLLRSEERNERMGDPLRTEGSALTKESSESIV